MPASTVLNQYSKFGVTKLLIFPQPESLSRLPQLSKFNCLLNLQFSSISLLLDPHLCHLSCLLSYCCDKDHDQKHLREGRVYFTSQFTFHHEENRRPELKLSGSNAYCLSSYGPLSLLSYTTKEFLIHAQEWHYPHQATPFISIIYQEKVSKTCIQATLMEAFPQT